jgi:hypothetical protein
MPVDRKGEGVAKVEVAGSTPVSRSNIFLKSRMSEARSALPHSRMNTYSLAASLCLSAFDLPERQ